MESSAHIEPKISQLIYIYRHEDKNVKALKKKFSKNGLFLDKIPLNLESMVTKNCIVCFDDWEDMLQKKEYLSMLIRFSSFLIHHVPCLLIVTVQSYQMFYAKSPLHPILFQCTSLVLFRSVHNFSQLRRILNSFDIPLKSGSTLYEIFKKFVDSRYKYIIVNISPCLDCPLVYSQIIYSDPRPFILFT